MVKVSLTVFENTLRVELEVGSINSNGNGTIGQSSIKGVTVTFVDFSVLGNGILLERRGILALSVLSGVRIVTSLGDLVINDVLESFNHPTTVATIRVVLGLLGTIN